jgi:hypothetical protein
MEILIGILVIGVVIALSRLWMPDSRSASISS